MDSWLNKSVVWTNSDTLFKLSHVVVPLTITSPRDKVVKPVMMGHDIQFYAQTHAVLSTQDSYQASQEVRVVE